MSWAGLACVGHCLGYAWASHGVIMSLAGHGLFSHLLATVWSVRGLYQPLARLSDD
jgi:hypothetical protein